MPQVIIQALRPVIIWIVQLGVTTAIVTALSSILKNIVDALAEHYDIDEDDSKIEITNKIIEIGLFIGVGSKVLSAKLGINAAKYLGFANGQLVKRVVSTKGAGRIASKGANVVVSSSILKKLGASMGKIPGTKILMILMLLQQAGDWFFFKRSLLQDTVDAVFGKDNIKLPGEKEAPPGFSQTEWDGFIKSIESVGIVGLKNEAVRQSQLYSRENVVTLMFWVYGEQVKKGESTTANQLQKAIQPYLVFGNKPISNVFTQQPTSQKAVTYPSAKVFSGVVSQGVLGENLTFTPRENDLIEDIAELKDSAHNNLVPFITSLPRLVTYEIKVVASILTKDGFRQVGTAQRIVSGKNQDGTNRYKTVVNKFAVLDLFIKTSTGSRTKLSTIVLGPVDSVRFQVAGSDLTSIATTLQKDIFTTKLPESITSENIITPAPVDSPVVANGNTPATATPIQQPLSVIPREYFVEYDSFYTRVMYILGDSIVFSPEFASLIPQDEKFKFGNYGGQTTEGIRRLLQMGVDASKYPHKRFANEINGRIAPAISTDSFQDFFSESVINGQNTSTPAVTPELPQAKTLFDFYNAKGLPLPSIQERSKLYESLGLGVASYYVGTSEQNTKLLAKLQGKNI